jgi:hypothetical protein
MDGLVAQHFELVYDAALKWPLLWHSYRGVFEGIPLDSRDANQFRHTHEMMKRLQESQAPFSVTPPPATRIAAELGKFEAGD